ncbi:MAG TPA: hypothetical protein VHP36_00150 [Chitinispirillaceae bacterium]|nr:hypothetical protein [Chitinispirillaceae bacterium]
MNNKQNQTEQYDRGFWEKNAFPFSTLILCLAYLITVSMIFLPYVWKGRSILDALGEAGVARGLITILFAVSTVFVTMMLTVYSVFINKNEIQAEEKVFPRAMQILSTLIGVLGTIVGFYFGQAVAQGEEQTKALKLEDALMETDSLSNNKLFKITANITGGNPPYNFTIKFVNVDTIKTISNLSSQNRIAELFEIPKKIPEDSIIIALTKVTDTNNSSIEDTLKLKVK